MAVVGAKLQRLNQENIVEDSQQGVGHARRQQTEPELQAMEVDQSDDQQGAGHTGHNSTRGQPTEPQAMEVDQSDGQQGMGTIEEDSEQETEPQAIETNQHETQVSDVSDLSI